MHGEGSQIVSREMLINVSEGEECRIALVENGRLEEIYMERASATSHVGNIYKGKVTNVEPAIQAAFIDFGLGRNGFLHISDLLPTYFGKRGEEMAESVGRKMSRRERPPIQRCLRRGDEITVQIIKEGIGTKGPTLSTYLSIPGRILVMMPGMENFGVSRKIEDDQERRRLRKIIDELDPIDGVGFIIRTAGMGKSKLDIEKDLKYLTRLWETITKISKTTKAPVELYTEGDLVTRTVRDVYGPDIDRIVIDSKEVGRRVKDFVKLTAPRGKTKVELHKDPIPLFHAYGIEKEIELIHSRHVPLPSGGSLVIDSTEAVVAIDVNSGKSREHSDAETTAFKTDMEAADEIPRQLKLRDLGGVIICDFIDLRFDRHRRQLEQRLFDNFKNDKAKTRVLQMSEFGIIEITRQRMRASLKRSIYSDCPHCQGHGLVKTSESMALDVMRKLAIAVHDQRVVRVDLGVCAEVAFFLGNRRRKQLSKLEDETGKPIEIRAQEGLALDEIKLDLFDARDGRVYIDALGMVAERDERGHRHGGHGGGHGGGRDHRQDSRQQNRPKPEPVRALDPIEDDEEDDQPQSRGGRRDQGQRGDRNQPRQRDRDDRDDRGGKDSRNDRNDRGARDGRDGRNAAATAVPEARRDRPEDRIRPIGVQPIRDGAGHRGPQVVQPDDFEGDEETDALAAQGEGTDSGGESGSVAQDGENGEGGEGGVRRRRRRRRGGRGRRRNRGGEEIAGVGSDTGDRDDSASDGGTGDGSAEDSDYDDADADTADDRSDADENRGDSMEDRERVSDSGRDSYARDSRSDDGSESSVGRAPAAIEEGNSGAFSGDDSRGSADSDLPEDASVETVADVADADEVVERAPRKSRAKAPKADAAPRSRAKRGRGKKADDAPVVAEDGPAEDSATVSEAASENTEEKTETESTEDSDNRRGGRSRRGRGRRGRGGSGEDEVVPVRAEVAAKRVPPGAAPVAQGSRTPASPAVQAKPAVQRAPTAVASRAPTPVNVPPKLAPARAATPAQPVTPARSVQAPAVPVRRMPTPVNIPGPLRSPTQVSVPPPLPSTGPVRTTSDKHLADDEPIDPQPLRRPKSYGDLDAIPDDLD